MWHEWAAFIVPTEKYVPWDFFNGSVLFPTLQGKIIIIFILLLFFFYYFLLWTFCSTQAIESDLISHFPSFQGTTLLRSTFPAPLKVFGSNLNPY